MSFEGSDNDFNYDSDKVDEELETQLYGAIFFDSHLSFDERSDVQESSSQNATQGIDRLENSVLASNTASFVSISSFQDEASAESDDFSIINDGDDQNINSTSCSSPLSESQSSHNDLPCFTIDSSESADDVSQLATDHWDASDVVIGVSNPSNSMVCNADDCEAIARRLARSRSDPNLWRVTRADRFSTPQAKRATRYFDDSFCVNCRQRGHLTSSCQRSGPVCILCGGEGHEKDGCPNVYCYVCFSFGHSKVNCSLANKLRQSVCQRCEQQGHSSKTEEGKPMRTPKRLQVRPRGCCNCGRSNHIAEDCLRRAFRSNFPGPIPHRRVRVYDKKDIYARLRRVLEKKSLKKLGRKKTTKEKTLSQKKMKRQKGSAKSETQDNSTLVEDEVVSLVEEQERVEQHLFNSFASRLHEDSTASPLADSGKSPETCDAPTAAITPQSRPPRRQSGDGAAFLPLTGTPARRGRGGAPVAGHKRPFPQSRCKLSTARDSPFTWINRSTSLHEINDQPKMEVFSSERSFHPEKPYASTSSFSYHDRWRRANQRSNESPRRMQSSKTGPSLLALESDQPYPSRRSRKQQQQQWKKKRLRKASPLPNDFETGHWAKEIPDKQRRRKKQVFPAQQFSRHDQLDPENGREAGSRKRRSVTPNSGSKLKRKDWMAFVIRSTDVDPWD